MAEEEIEKKVVSLPEAIIFMLATVLAEIFEFFLSATLIGIIVSVLINLFVGSLTFIFLYFKGNSGALKNKVRKRVTRSLSIYLFGAVADTVTGGFLPIKAICLGVTIYMLNHPKLDQLADQAVEIYVHPERTLTLIKGGGGSSVKGEGKEAPEKIAPRKFTGAVIGKTETLGASTTRQRMTMATRASSAGVVGAKRMEQSIAREQVNSQAESEEREAA